MAKEVEMKGYMEQYLYIVDLKQIIYLSWHVQLFTWLETGGNTFKSP